MRVQYGALPYRFTPEAAIEILIVTTRQSRRWIIPKGWPIKGLKPPNSAAREAFEEAGVRGRVRGKSIGLFTYDKVIDESGLRVSCEVLVFPLLVKRQSEAWPEREQRMAQWVAPGKAVALIREPELKALVAAFAERDRGAAPVTKPANPIDDWPTAIDGCCRRLRTAASRSPRIPIARPSSTALATGTPFPAR